MTIGGTPITGPLPLTLEVRFPLYPEVLAAVVAILIRFSWHCGTPRSISGVSCLRIAAQSCIASIDHASSFLLFVRLSTPSLLAPEDGVLVLDLGPQLKWAVEGATTQYHIQVLPYAGDGPAIDLIISDGALGGATSYAVPAPVFGKGPYVILPGMTYSWRARTTTATTPLLAQDAGWSIWSAARTFRTNTPVAWGISSVGPSDGAVVAGLRPTLQWRDRFVQHFYYEVQVSADPEFGPHNFLYWELRHGGLSNPLDSYMIPENYPLAPSTRYYWRVRPRVQGDGSPVAWSDTWRFSMP